MSDLLTTRSALLDAMERMAGDHPAYPAGSVIRCFAREVMRARRSGIPHTLLVEVAEARTRVALVRRRAGLGSAVAAG